MGTPDDLQRSLERRHLARNFRQVCELFGKGGVNLQGEILERLMAKPNIDESFSVVDVGSGSNEAIEHAARSTALSKFYMGMGRAAEFIGIDKNPLNAASPETLAVGNQIGLDNKPIAVSREGDVCQLPLEDGSVDVLYSSGTLIYVVDSLKAFVEGYRVLKPGGVAVWDVPESNIAFGFTFEQILDRTPGAKEVFTYIPVSKSEGIVVCRKTSDDTFKGFPFEVLREVGYKLDGESGEDEVLPRVEHFRTAVYRATDGIAGA